MNEAEIEARFIRAHKTAGPHPLRAYVVEFMGPYNEATRSCRAMVDLRDLEDKALLTIDRAKSSYTLSEIKRDLRTKSRPWWKRLNAKIEFV